jgi:hypothetical protein
MSRPCRPRRSRRSEKAPKEEIRQVIEDAVAGKTRVETSSLAVAACVVIAVQSVLSESIPKEELREVGDELLRLVYQAVERRIISGIQRRGHH